MIPLHELQPFDPGTCKKNPILAKMSSQRTITVPNKHFLALLRATAPGRTLFSILAVAIKAATNPSEIMINTPEHPADVSKSV